MRKIDSLVGNAISAPSDLRGRMRRLISRLIVALPSGALIACNGGGANNSTAADTGSDSPQAAAARYVANEAAVRGLTRLNGAEIRAAVVGRRMTYRDAPPSTIEEFLPDGTAHSAADNAERSARYSIVSDMLCKRVTGNWHCRRFYRNGDNALFQQFSGARSPILEVIYL